MVLNERKIKILEAIVTDYIKTAEPIGSRTIAKHYDFGISSATIRNEMSDLEDLGLIVQPYTSSGRVPSDKGYRLYVDSIMKHKDISLKEQNYLKNIVLNNLNQIDGFMEQTAKILSRLTNYTAIVSEPKVVSSKIKLIQLLPLDNVSIVMVLITDTKVVKNYEIIVGIELDYKFLQRLSTILNNNLYNLTIEDISLSIINKIKDATAEEKRIIRIIFESIGLSLGKEEQLKLYTSGAKNILEFPEFSDLVKAREIFQTFEDKNLLVNLLSYGTKTDKIEIIIGSENSLENMKNCSIIKANYSLNEDMIGSIGIIGPTRMNYPQVVAVINEIVRNINQILISMSEDP